MPTNDGFSATFDVSTGPLGQLTERRGTVAAFGPEVFSWRVTKVEVWVDAHGR